MATPLNAGVQAAARLYGIAEPLQQVQQRDDLIALQRQLRVGGVPAAVVRREEHLERGCDACARSGPAKCQAPHAPHTNGMSASGYCCT